MTYHPVYPKLFDQLLFRVNLYPLENLYPLHTGDEYGFTAVSSNWPFMPYGNQFTTGSALRLKPYTAKSVCKEKDILIPINETLTKAGAMKKCAELNATLCKEN